MDEQEVTIELPVVKTIIGDEETLIMGPIKTEVSDANEIKKSIRKAIPDYNLYWDMQRDIVKELVKGINVTFKDGTVIKVPMVHIKKNSWKFDINISTSMINKTRGKHVPVTYGNFVHNALYKIQKNRDKLHVSTKAKAALTSLGFVTKDAKSITSIGAVTLGRLEKIDPAEDKSCRMKFTRALVSGIDPTTPAFTFALENDYVHYVEEDDEPREYWYIKDFELDRDPISRFYPTKKGAQWLEANCEQILRHHSCSQTRRLQMIPFMPMSHLNVYLTSTKQHLRLVAKARLNALEGDS